MSDGPTPEEEIELETVNHPYRTTFEWALFSLAVLFIAWWMTR